MLVRIEKSLGASAGTLLGVDRKRPMQQKAQPKKNRPNSEKR